MFTVSPDIEEDIIQLRQLNDDAERIVNDVIDKINDTVYNIWNTKHIFGTADIDRVDKELRDLNLL